MVICIVFTMLNKSKRMVICMLLRCTREKNGDNYKVNSDAKSDSSSSVSRVSGFTGR